MVSERHRHKQAKNMRRLLLDTCREAADADAKKLSETRFEEVSMRYRAILTEGRRELPERPPRKGKKAASPNPRQNCCSMRSKPMKLKSCVSPAKARCRSATTEPSATCEWRKSNRRSQEPSETSITPKLTVASPAACSRCPAKAAARLPQCRSHSTAMRCK